MEYDAKAAQQHLMDSAASRETAAKSVALGTAAMAGTEKVSGKSVTINGREQQLDVGGAGLAIRVHNVCIDIDWLGARYTTGADGVPTDVVGLPRESALQHATAVAKAIIPHIK